MLVLLEAEVDIPLFLGLIMRHQDLDRVGPDLGLGVKVSDPGIHKDIVSLIKVTPYEQIFSKFLSVVIGEFG